MTDNRSRSKLVLQIGEARERLKELQGSSQKNVSEILRRRAERAAIPDPDKNTGIEELSVLCFVLGQEKYAFETRYLNEVIPAEGICQLPSVPEFITGILNHRGKIITVIDLKRLLHLEYVGITDEASVIIVERGTRQMGILADRLEGIHRIPAPEVRQPDHSFIKIRDAFLKGITGDSLILLNVEGLMDPGEMEVNQKIQTR